MRRSITKIICFFSVVVTVLSCNKGEQKLVLDNGHQITEEFNGQDYRKAFEGDYEINCYGYGINTSVRLLPTDKKSITFDPLYGKRGTSDWQVWVKLSAEIDTSGSFKIPLQEFTLSDSPLADRYRYSGSGKFRSDSTLIVNFYIGGALRDICMCSGKRK